MAVRLTDAGGTLRTLASIKLRDGTGLKSARTLRMLDADGVTLRTVATFVSALTVSAPDASKLTRGDGGAATVTASSIATPSGGATPYTYAWSKLSGTFALSGTTSAAISFTETLEADTTSTGTAKVIVTDALGSTAEATITVTLTNAGPILGGTS